MLIDFNNVKPVRTATVMIGSTEFHDDTPAKRSHAAEPIKSLDDISTIQDYLINCKRYRDNLIFTMGINFGLRCGDLIHIKVGNIIDDTGHYKEEVVLQEEKTKKYRTVYLNDAVADAADLYFMHLGTVDLDDYLFRSESNRGKNTGKPIAVRSIEWMLKEVINKKLGIDLHASTHLLRKTFAYHVIMTAPDRDRALEFLMKILGHSSQAITLRYAGITDDEIKDTYQNLNLGKGSSTAWIQSTGLFRKQTA